MTLKLELEKSFQKRPFKGWVNNLFMDWPAASLEPAAKA